MSHSEQAEVAQNSEQNQAVNSDKALLKPAASQNHLEETPKQDQSSTSKNEFIEKPKLRTIAQRPEIPQNKEDLIKFLVDRLQQAEDAINDTQSLLQEERKKKDEIMRDLDRRTKQLNELLNEEKNTIQQKVQRELKSTLESAMGDRLNSEHQRDEYRKQSEEKDREIGELRGELFQHKEQIRNYEAENAQLKHENTTFQARLTQLERENHQIKKEKAEWDEKFRQLQNEVEEHKSVVQKLSDVKMVLNKVIGEGNGAISQNSSKKAPSVQAQASQQPGGQQHKREENNQDGSNKQDDQFWF